jgi:hypothetical protein
MWLKFLMDDCLFSNITKIILKLLHLIIFGKIKSFKISKNRHILFNGNNIVKDLLNAFKNSH